MLSLSKTLADFLDSLLVLSVHTFTSNLPFPVVMQPACVSPDRNFTLTILINFKPCFHGINCPAQLQKPACLQILDCSIEAS